ncbi:MAG: dienelactone hydrolase family protein [Caulobacteraceae bacterium]|nr:dienelactone hydrolase family protein [Caulobacteraceae bacterium]
MARRLASVGYYVMLPNLYYRQGVMEIGAYLDPGVRERMVALMNTLSIDLVMSDVRALIDFLDADAAARTGSIGVHGYCMSGQFAINARFPTRIAAAASIYGTYLVTDRPDSPHVQAHKTKAELYFACAETDPWASMEDVETLKRSLQSSNVAAEVEVYWGAEHAFAFPSRTAYQKASAERHWERVLALYRRRLG